MSAGGSAGHNCRLALDITERRPDGSPCWEVVCRTPKELAVAENKAKEAKRQKQRDKAAKAGKAQIIEVLTDTFPNGEIKNQLKNASGLNGNNFTAAFRELLKNGALELFDITRNGRTYQGYRLPPKGTKETNNHNNTGQAERFMVREPTPLRLGWIAVERSCSPVAGWKSSARSPPPERRSPRPATKKA